MAFQHSIKTYANDCTVLFSAADIAYECRYLSKQDSERNANQLKLKNSEMPSTSSETVAQYLARTGQFVSAGTSDSKDQTNVNAAQSSVEAENTVRK